MDEDAMHIDEAPGPEQCHKPEPGHSVFESEPVQSDIQSQPRQLDIEFEPEHFQLADLSVETSDTTLYEYPTLFSSKTLLELCNSSWSQSANAKQAVQPYLRGCKWSPDGTCCLTVVNNDGVHLTELPKDLYTGTVSTDRVIDVLGSTVHTKEAGLVYDFCWYPGMNSYIPETCCWITTRQNAPIQMWDAFDGSLRCSYRGFNAVDEMEPALSVTFNSDGTRIIAGYKKVLRTFEVERPGRDFAEHKINSAASCFATDRNLLAMGSWNAGINLYNMNEIGAYKSIGKMNGDKSVFTGGVTHLKFTPNSLKLVSGSRMDHRLVIWDLRYFKHPLNILNRVVKTNQRIYFDVSPCGKYLITGGTDGVVKVWNINVANIHADNATFRFPLHRDCCNSISIHPIRPILATGSGQYHFNNPILTLDNETEDENRDSVLNKSDNDDLSLNSDVKYSSDSENSLVFWWIGDISDKT